MQTSNPAIREIRRTGVSKVNNLVRAARHLDDLRGAFADWQAGEIYICKKSGDFRYRFGARSKQVAAWSPTARQLFPTLADFALAACVLGPDPELARATAEASRVLALPAPQQPQSAAAPTRRVNVLALAAAQEGAY